MPSLADIPTRLLKADHRQNFLLWLSEQPVDMITAPQFMALWCHKTNQHLTPDDLKWYANAVKARTVVPQ